MGNLYWLFDSNHLRVQLQVYTQERFLLLFKPVIHKACTLKVVGTRQTASFMIYTLTKYRRQGVEWHATYCPSSVEFRCSCERLESLGIPFEHLIAVLVQLDKDHLPDSIVLNRWKKSVKDTLGVLHNDKCVEWDPALVSQYIGVVECCKRMTMVFIHCCRPEYLQHFTVTYKTDSIFGICCKRRRSRNCTNPPDWWLFKEPDSC